MPPTKKKKPATATATATGTAATAEPTPTPTPEPGAVEFTSIEIPEPSREHLLARAAKVYSHGAGNPKAAERAILDGDAPKAGQRIDPDDPQGHPCPVPGYRWDTAAGWVPDAR